MEAALKFAKPITRVALKLEVQMKSSKSNGKTGKVETFEPKEAFERFEGAMRKILTVSKKELVRREKKWKAKRNVKASSR